MLVEAALAVGALEPIQAAVNDHLCASIGAPMPPAFFSVFSAFLCAALVALLVSGGLFDFAPAAGGP